MGVEILELHHQVEESDRTTVPVFLLVLTLLACPVHVLLRWHLHVHAAMSAWTEGSLDLDGLLSRWCVDCPIVVPVLPSSAQLRMVNSQSKLSLD